MGVNNRKLARNRLRAHAPHQHQKRTSGQPRKGWLADGLSM